MDMASIRLTGHLLGRLGAGFVRGEIPLSGIRFALRRQRLVAHAFRDAKYVRVNGRTFMDPFAPYFPSPAFSKVIHNFTREAIPPPPNYAQISITNLCPCRCFHCHVQNTQRGDMPRDVILSLIQELVENGFPMLFFVGGEPFSRFDDLEAFVRAASPHMDTRMFTSGVGASPERLARLRAAGLAGVYVSLDAADAGVHNAKRRHPKAYDSACETIRQAVAQGFYVSVVCCTTGTMVRDGSFRAVVDLAERLGSHSIQLNEIRPAGNAGETSEHGVFLTREDKAALIVYYREQNRSPRRIAISMPWYLEEPGNLGCMATSGQSVYVDAQGHVQPCQLLKVSLGNIRERRFGEIWREFRAQARYPVADCIVWNYRDQINASPVKPLPVAATLKSWPAMTSLPMADTYAGVYGGQLAGAAYSQGYFDRKYALALTRGADYAVREHSWLARRLNVRYLALGSTLHASGPVPNVPRHEFLHLAQFRRFGIVRVLAHYVRHAAVGLIRHRDPGRAFRDVPFEAEARAYERLCLEQEGTR
jgi:MoaA/NifB/PqqE/SkfB family radical SAM enzyme